MKRGRVSALVVALALATPAAAQNADCAPGQIGCGSLGGILGDLMRQVDPWLSDLAEMLGDLSGWHTPEVLPNGDILIRRRQPAVPPPVQPDEDGSAPPVTDPLEL